MKRIVLISCVSKKHHHRSKAKDLYTSPLFTMNLQYARSLIPDRIFILSAKHGLVCLDDEIDPYDETLNTKTSKEIKYWATQVLDSLKGEISLERDEVIFLAGDKYRKYLVPFIKNYQIPLKGLTIGKQLQYLKGKVGS
ncbi:DUF6884 domain-containing protein [Robertmurraya sp.]|uniref:DUF6884 domain-containing protein n=1 Tax=Robertmurraya sp. TaxID=2837525 RepID=UPI003704C950